jgi:hypothetical protein
VNPNWWSKGILLALYLPFQRGEKREPFIATQGKTSSSSFEIGNMAEFLGKNPFSKDQIYTGKEF